MAYELKDLQGSLFKNNKKTTDNHPEYTGKIKINGTEFLLSAWVKETKTGEKWLSLSAKEAMPNGNTSSSNTFGAKNGTDLPF